VLTPCIKPCITYVRSVTGFGLRPTLPTHTSSIDKENTEGGLANTGGVQLVDVSALLPGGEVSDLRCNMPYAILQ